MATKARKDSRGYALKKGESQRKDGRYVFRYTTIRLFSKIPVDTL